MKRYLIVMALLFFSTQVFAAKGQIYVQRVNTSGVAVGSPIVVDNGATYSQSKPRVAFYDGTFLVTWQEWNGTDLDVKAARIEMDGTVTDDPPITIDDGTRNQCLPDVDADGTGWMVVWSAFDGTAVTPSVFVGRVTSGGTPPASPTKIGANPYGTSWTDVGFGPKITWSSEESKFLVQYTGTINSSLSNGISWATATSVPVVTEFPAISTNWVLTGVSVPTEFQTAMMPGGGWTTIYSGAEANLFTSGKPTIGAFNMLGNGTFDTDGYVSKGTDLSQTWGTGGALLLDNNDYSIYGAGAATDGNYVVGVWARYSVGDPSGFSLTDGDLYAARVDKHDPVEAVGGTAISTVSGVEEEYPAIAGDGSGTMLVAYERTTAGSTEIVSRLLTVTSSISAGSPVELRDDTTGSRRGQIDIAYGDDGLGADANNPLFLVVWTEGFWGTL